eukprot:m.61472 g.61472  ORF g.61472 m.61472 type:complete len:311 (+) comp7342_c0_seq2:31-963(+)
MDRKYSAAAAMHGAKKRHPGKAILAGGIAGGIEICITYPTEYVKTHLQFHRPGEKPFNGPVDVIRHTLDKHGPTGFYRGISSLLYGSVPKVGVRFMSYEVARNMLVDKDNRLTPARTFLAGLISGASEAVVIVAPMETVKVKFIADQHSPQPRFTNFFQATAAMLRENGIRSIYQGVGATVAKQASNQAIRFSVYNPLKSYFQGGDPSVNIGIPRTMLCGAIAGAASVYGNTPIDVIKTRMQSLDAHKYRSTWHCVQVAWQEGGGTLNGARKVFYRGTTPRLGRVCADVAIVMVLYEQVMKVLDRVWVTD